MLRATDITRHYHSCADQIILDETDRHRRRMKMTSQTGIEFLLDMPEVVTLRHGDGLKLSNGTIIKVIAKDEPLYEISARDPHHLLQLAWQLGNRHLPAQIFETHIHIRADHVIKEMIEGLGGTVTDILAPFDPEGGAYGKASPSSQISHSHSHDHTHDHKHDHKHD